MDALTAAMIIFQGHSVHEVIDQGHGVHEVIDQGWHGAHEEVGNLDERKSLIRDTKSPRPRENRLSCPWRTSSCSPLHSWAPPPHSLSTVLQRRWPTGRRGWVQKEEPGSNVLEIFLRYFEGWWSWVKIYVARSKWTHVETICFVWPLFNFSGFVTCWFLQELKTYKTIGWSYFHLAEWK